MNNAEKAFVLPKLKMEPSKAHGEGCFVMGHFPALLTNVRVAPVHELGDELGVLRVLLQLCIKLAESATGFNIVEGLKGSFVELCGLLNLSRASVVSSQGCPKGRLVRVRIVQER